MTCMLMADVVERLVPIEGNLRHPDRECSADTRGPHCGGQIGTSCLTRDYLVTYHEVVTDDDRVQGDFYDLIAASCSTGSSSVTAARWTDLESEFTTRFGVMKHLCPRRRRARRHPTVGTGEAPLPQSGADPADPRPVDRQYRERQVSALVNLKTQLEETA